MMLQKIFFKEWRENLLIFALSIAMLVGLVVLNLSGETELTMYFTGMFLWLFLPFAALLIGSSGYYSEFKDSAWIYLFSRPVKKWKIWLIKYVALLSIFFSVYLILQLLISHLPGLKEILDDSGLLFMMQGLLVNSPYLLVSLLALTIAYAVSFLSEKQFVLVFVSILIGTAFLFLAWKYQEFLIMTYFYRRGMDKLAVLVGLSFLGASLLTFIKCDFSQRGKKIFRFSRYIVLFIICSFIIHTVWVTEGRMFSPRTVFLSFHSHKINSDVYLKSFQHGIIKYDSRRDEFLKLNRASRFSEEIFSVSGEKVVFLKDIRRGKNEYRNLWIMNADGSEEEVLIESHKKESHFHDKRIESCLLSVDGSRVAFTTVRWERNRRYYSLWWMDADGKRAKNIDVKLPNHRRFRLVAWEDPGDCIFLTAEEKTMKAVPNTKLMRFDLESGTYQILWESLVNHMDIPVSPKHDLLVLVYRSRDDNKSHMTLFNMKTLESRELASAESRRTGRIRWNRDGSKLVFWKFLEGVEIWTYSLADDEMQKVGYGSYGYGLNYDWLASSDKLVVSDYKREEPRIRVLDIRLGKERQVSLPEEVERHWQVWGLDDAVLVQRSRWGGFWRLDLKTETWKKVF